MNKNEFLEKLEKKLNILEESERKDIINEYKDILEEKIKHGKTEEEAVKDFGDFDELIKEILKAYKINPQNSKDKAKEILDAGEVLIKDSAKKLSESADKLIKNISKEDSTSTIQNIFEILLKAICILVIIAILTVPFKIVLGLGSGIIGSMFGMGTLFSALFKLLGSALFIIICVLLISFLFKDNFKEIKNKSQENNITYDDENKNINEKQVKIKSNENTSTFSNLVLILLKLFIIFIFIIPIWIIIIIGFVFFAILIYFLIKGINVIGFTLALLGGLMFLIECSNLIYNGLFNKAKLHLITIITGAVLIVVGTIMSIDFITGINYINKAPKVDTKIKEYNFNISENTEFDVGEGNKLIKIDNNLKDGEVKIEASYAYNFTTVEKAEFTNEDGIKEVNFYARNIINGREIYDMVIENLKNNKFYEYDDLTNIDIIVKCNENTKGLVILDD